MPRRTNPFQQLTASIMAVFHEPEYHVRESELVKVLETGVVRELDILITHNSDPKKIILVECRGHVEGKKRPRKQNVQWIDELEGKARRLGFRNIVAVSSSGFTKTAIAEGKARGIETLHLKEAEEMDWRSWWFGLETFGVNVELSIVVTGIGYSAPEDYPDPLPDEIDPENVYIVDFAKKTKIPLYIVAKEIEQKEHIVKQITAKNDDNRINNYKYVLPCNPNQIGLLLEGENQIIPLVELVFDLRSGNTNQQIPLQHFKLGESQVQVGDTEIFGKNVRFVIREENKEVSILIEERQNSPDKKPPTK